MTRLLVHVEGETEESFVNEVLAPHLYSVGFHSVSPRLLGNARQRDRRGGIRPWPSAKNDILRHLRNDSGCIITTMIDYYALPSQGQKAWPGRQNASLLPFPEKAPTVEAGIMADILADMGNNFNPMRCVPYVVMHEFEGLLFSDPSQFAAGIYLPNLQQAFQSIRDQFASPEEINDSPITAPSKRVLELIPNYQKPLLGTLAALQIGLITIRRECPFFNQWVAKLEALATVQF
jgi:hypothetical protein